LINLANSVLLTLLIPLSNSEDFKILPLYPPPLRKEGEEREEGLMPFRVNFRMNPS
jgi:hypothetical protein